MQIQTDVAWFFRMKVSRSTQMVWAAPAAEQRECLNTWSAFVLQGSSMVSKLRSLFICFTKLSQASETEAGGMRHIKPNGNEVNLRVEVKVWTVHTCPWQNVYTPWLWQNKIKVYKLPGPQQPPPNSHCHHRLLNLHYQQRPPCFDCHQRLPVT